MSNCAIYATFDIYRLFCYLTLNPLYFLTLLFLIAIFARSLTLGHKYPQISKSWLENWSNLVTFLEYPDSIRKIIYTTNSIESLNNQLRKVTRNKRIFPSDDAVFKSLYLTIRYITRKWTMPVQNWNETMAHFLIKFEGRVER